MKYKFTGLAIGLLLIAGHVYGQSQKIRFASLTQLGLMAGDNDEVPSFQTVNGIRYKTYYAGAGAGLDYYFVKTVPVFFELRKDLFNKKETPYVYAAYGRSLPIAQENSPAFGWGGPLVLRRDYKAGSYLDLGIGYRVFSRTGLAASFSIGYSKKTLDEEQYYGRRIPGGPIVSEGNSVFYEYTLRRVSIRFGLGF